MIYKVYHAVNPRFCPPHPALHDCELVAEVEVNEATVASNLEEVFRITNHIDHAWFTNPEVKWHMGKSRSTSVGDIVETDNGAFWRVEGAGWSQI